MHQSSILVHMRTTLNLDDELLRRAREYTGIQEKTVRRPGARRRWAVRCPSSRRDGGGEAIVVLVDTSVWIDHFHRGKPS